MQLRTHSLTFLATTLLLLLTRQSAVAFTIKYPPVNGSFRPFVPYRIGDYEGLTWLIEPEELERGGTNELLELLETFSGHRGGKWEFITPESDLQGHFQINSYYACAPQTLCGFQELLYPKTDGVGAYFDVAYYPILDKDPIPSPMDGTRYGVQWIQRVKSNHKSDEEEPSNPFLHGIIEDVLDISTGASTPYYTASSGVSYDDDGAIYKFFTDTPYRPDPLNNHTWNAFLFLTEDVTPAGSATKTIKIHNGIKWGWRNLVLRKPKSESAPVNEKEEEILEPAPVPACPPEFESSLGDTDGGGVVVSGSGSDSAVISDRGENECQVSIKFSESLSSGTEEDKFNVKGLTPGATFYAWTNNDLASNRCNPNTYLSGYNDDGYFLGADDNSSQSGDGFGSAVFGTVSSNGRINLSVKAARGGARGEDEGNYELYVNVFDSEDPPYGINSVGGGKGGIVIGNSGSSGGGGIVMGTPDDGSIIVSGGSGGGGIDISTPGRSQQNPLFPDSIDSEGWQTFNNVPGCRWYDPPIAKTFEFVATDNTLFTEILDFPTGEDNLFTVVVEDMILGEYSPGDRVDFVSLLGKGISNFKITDIDYLVGSTEETYFPIQLAFDKNVGSFKMRMVEEEEPPKKKVPESNSIWGLIALGAFGLWKIRGWKNRNIN
jgi:hypothetical protein